MIAKGLESQISAAGLDKRAIKIFRLFLERPNEILSKDDILAQIWPGQIVHENSLHQAIGRLRKAIADDGTIFETVYGRGYRLNLFIADGKDAADSDAAQDKAGSDRKWLFPSLAVVVLAILAASAFWFSRTGGETKQSASAEASALLADEILVKADPYSGPNYDPGLRSVVEKLSADIDTRFAGDPQLLARLHHRIGTIISGWGDHKKAAVHIKRAAELAASNLGEQNAFHILALADLCHVERLGGDLGAADAHCKQALALAHKYNSPALSKAEITQAKYDFEIGEYRNAQSLLEPLVNAPDFAKLEKELRADALWFLALSYRKLAMSDESGNMFLQLVDTRKREWGAGHPLTAWALADYGDFLADIGHDDQARSVLLESERIFAKTVGADHVDRYAPIYSLGMVDLHEKQWSAAISKFESIYDVYKDQLGEAHFWTLYTASQLAYALAGQGRQKEAVAILGKTRKLAEPLLYGKHEKAAYFEMVWAETEMLAGNIKNARELAKRANHDLSLGKLGQNHPWHQRLARLLADG